MREPNHTQDVVPSCVVPPRGQLQWEARGDKGWKMNMEIRWQPTPSCWPGHSPSLARLPFMKMTPKITRRRPSFGVSLVLKKFLLKKGIYFQQAFTQAPQAVYPSSFPSIPQLGDNSTPTLPMTCYVTLNPDLLETPRKKPPLRMAMFPLLSHLTFLVCQPGTQGC